MRYPKALLQLTMFLQKFPGIGKKSALRFAFQMLEWEPSLLQEFGELTAKIKETVHFCSICGVLCEDKGCLYCENPNRDFTSMCILTSAKDVYTIEETKIFNGIYHVLPHLLSPKNGFDESLLNTEKLKTRIEKNKVCEVILAFDSTLEADATALFLKEDLSPLPISISRLALGLPLGSSLEYIDSGTLSRALEGRRSL